MGGTGRIGFERKSVPMVIVTLIGSLALIATPRASAEPVVDQAYTPVIQEVVSPPRWYEAVDGKLHVEYELRLTNGFPVAATVLSITVRGVGGRGVITELSGDPLAAAISPVGSPGVSGATIPPSSAAFAFIDFTVANRDRLPEAVRHTVRTQIEPGLPVDPIAVSRGARTRVHQGPPPVIDPPVRGARWIPVVGPHRRSVQPVNGSFVNGQRFAIDWNRLDEQYLGIVGDPSLQTSSPSYGRPVLAVDDAKVVAAVDGIPDQPANGFTPVGLAEADGNHVILKLEPGVYAGYAHLVPGSVTVKRGDSVRAGERIGELGNSGNSNGAHLHFQLMNRPSLLASDGLPFIFDRFTVTGRVPSFDALGEAYTNGTAVPIVPGGGRYRDLGPLGLELLTLP